MLQAKPGHCAKSDATLLQVFKSVHSIVQADNILISTQLLNFHQNQLLTIFIVVKTYVVSCEAYLMNDFTSDVTLILLFFKFSIQNTKIRLLRSALHHNRRT